MGAETSKQRSRFLLFTAIAVITLVGLFLFQLLGPQPKIIVSRQSTFITEPLTAEGLPDYAAYLLQHGSEGVTPQNNAAVLLWRATWPGELPQQHWLPFCEAIGLEEVPAEAEGMQELTADSTLDQVTDWLVEHYAEKEPEGILPVDWRSELRDYTARQLVASAQEFPWQYEQVPPLADWIARNGRSLNLLVEGSSRSKYWSPPPALLSGAAPVLLDAESYDYTPLRSAARGLTLRSMWHLGEGRLEEAWGDLYATHRWARLAAQKPDLVALFVSLAIESVASRGTQVLLADQRLENQLARRIQNDLQNLAEFDSVTSSLNQAERLYLLDSSLRMANGKLNFSDLSGAGGPSEPDGLLSMRIDGTAMLMTINNWCDRFVAASREPTRQLRESAMAEVEHDLGQMYSGIIQPGNLLGGLVSAKSRGKTLANMLTDICAPPLRVTCLAQDTTNNSSAMLQLAAALAVYRTESESYPENLEQLLPDYLKQMPMDVFSNQPFIYRRMDDGGYLLYSVYRNEVDDNGTSRDGDIVDGEWVEISEDLQDIYPGGDIVIRVPFPKFAVRPPPSFE